MTERFTESVVEDVALCWLEERSPSGWNHRGMPPAGLEYRPRDVLLSMLISGDLRMKQVEKIVGAVA